MSKADMKKAKTNLQTNIFIAPTKTREYKRSRKVILKYNLKGARAVRSQLAEISIYVGAVYQKRKKLMQHQPDGTDGGIPYN